MDTINFTQHIKEHLLAARMAILSTITRNDQELSGFPMGSIVPVIWFEERPIILIAHLAEHTKNILSNPAASLLFYENAQGNVQQQWRICAMGNMIALSKTESALVLPIYITQFPESAGYYKNLNFRFFALNCLKFRIIEGFGRAKWLTPSAIFSPSCMNTDL